MCYFMIDKRPSYERVHLVYMAFAGTTSVLDLTNSVMRTTLELEHLFSSSYSINQYLLVRIHRQHHIHNEIQVVNHHHPSKHSFEYTIYSQNFNHHK